MRRSRPTIYRTYLGGYDHPPTYVRYTKPRQYGLSNFIGDVVMTGLTLGWWLVWVFVREVCR